MQAAWPAPRGRQKARGRLELARRPGTAPRTPAVDTYNSCCWQGPAGAAAPALNQPHQPNPALNLELNLEKSAADSQPGRGWIASAGSLLKGPWSFRPTIIWNSGCPAAPLCFLCLRCLPVLFLFSFFVAPALKCTTVLQGCWTRKLSLLTCQMSSAMVGKAGVACDCLVFPAFPIDLKK